MTVQELNFDDVQMHDTPPPPSNYPYWLFAPLVLLLLAWWLYSEIPLAITGIAGLHNAIADYLQQPDRVTEDDILIFWVLITGLKEGVQFVLQFAGHWFTASWRRLGLGLIILLLWIVFGVFDVVDTSTGLYVRFMPLDLNNINWGLVGGTTAFGGFGSIVAQFIAFAIISEWYKEWRGKRHDNHEQVSE